MERLREHLGVECWLMYGGSWGATLTLAYAERFPRRVDAIVLVAVTTTRLEEIDWLYHGPPGCCPPNGRSSVAASRPKTATTTSSSPTIACPIAGHTGSAAMGQAIMRAIDAFGRR